MKSIIKKLINKVYQKPPNISNTVIKEIVSRFEIKKLNILRDNGNNFIYSVGEKQILKITEQSCLSYETIAAQTDWQQFLFEQGLPVVCAFNSVNNLKVEKVHYNNTYYAAALYAKANGDAFTELLWDTKMYEQMGRLMGKMHNVTKQYNEKSKKDISAWHTAEVELIKKRIPGQYKIIDEMMGYLKLMQDHKKTPDNYGVVHNDFHRGNMFVDKNSNVTLFDFDDTTFAFFANDIACCFYQSIKLLEDDKSKGLAHIPYFIDTFLNGYLQENNLSETEIKLIPAMTKSRAISVYAYLHKVFDMNNLLPHQATYLKQAQWYVESDFLLKMMDKS